MDQILSDMPEGWEVIIINSDSDGLDQLIQALEGREDIAAIHLFSHGESGRIYLGSESYTLEDLQMRTEALDSIGHALTTDGDILLYGCDIGADFIGQEFVEQLSALTGADIAASNDATGNTIYGGDWTLETQSGNIDSQTLEAESYTDILTTTTIGIDTENINLTIGRNAPRLYTQASGFGGSSYGWYGGDNNDNWVDFYTKDAITPFFATRWHSIRFLFWTFRWPEIYINNYNYGSGVRYGTTSLDISHAGAYDIKVNGSNFLKNQLGGTVSGISTTLMGNHALYKGSFDPTNPLANLVTASEWYGNALLYTGELDAGRYTVISSYDSWEWVSRSNALFAQHFNTYAEQQYGTYTVIVDNLNHAPSWTANNLNSTLTGADELSYAIPLSSVSDSDGDEITVTATLQNGSALPAWLSFNANNFTFTGNPPANTSPLAIRLTADDGQETTNKDFTITYTNDNDQPIVAQILPDQLWNGSGVFSYTIPDGTFTDADPGTDSFTYTATLADNSALPSWLTMASNGVLSGNPPANFANLSVKVIANDGSGQANATQSATFNLKLVNNNDIAVLSNVSKALNEDGILNFSSADFTFNDSDTHSSADTLTGAGKTLQTARILSLTDHGTLWLDSDNDDTLDGGEAIQINQEISTSDLAKLRYTPDANWASTAGADTFNWVGSDGVDYAADAVTTSITVNLVNDIPSLTFSEGLSLNVRPGGGAVLGSILVDSGLKITDVDGPYTNDPAFDTIKSATVTITDKTSGSFVTGDSLSLSNNGGFTVSYDTAQGILTIVGDGRAADYQAILRTLRFSSSDTGNNHERTVDIVLRTGTISSTQVVSYDHFTETSGGDSQGWVYDLSPTDLNRTNTKPDISGGLIKMEDNSWIGKHFELNNIATKIEFELSIVDSWDGGSETFSIRLGGASSDIVIPFTLGSPKPSPFGGAITLNGKTVSYIFTPLTDGNSSFIGTNWADQKFLVTLDLPTNTVNNLALYFKSNLSDSGPDESYRIDNVTLYQDKASTYSGSFDNFVSPGWYNHPDSANGPSVSGWPQYITVEGSTALQFVEGQPSKSFKIDNNPTRVEFDFYRLDSWDDENFSVLIQNTQLFSHSFNVHTEVTTPITGSSTIDSKAVTYTITPLTFSDFFTDHSSNFNDQKFHIAIDIPTDFGEAFELRFDNDLNEAVNNESAAIDNLRVFTNTPDQFTNASRTVTVRETNNTPTTSHWAGTLDEDSQLSFNSTNFTTHFSDSDGDTLNSITLTSLPANGTLALNGSVLANNTVIATNDLNQLIFTPIGNFHGSTSFTYTASDGFATSASTSITLTVNAINDAPELNSSSSPELTAIDEDDTTSTGTSIADLIVDGSITEPADGSAVEAIAVTSVDNTFGIWQYNVASAGWTVFTATTGEIVNLNTASRLLDSSDLMRFIPNADYNGNATINFRAWDKSSGSAGNTTNPFSLGGNTSVSTQEDSINITINPINDAPSTSNNSITLDEDSVYSFSADDFSFTDIDTADTLQSVTIVSVPINGSLSWNNGSSDIAVTENQVISLADINTGKLKFTPATDAFGVAYSTFTFKVGDGDSVSSIATIILDVTDANDAPTAINWETGGSVAEDQAEGVIVGKLSATDPNTGETFSFVRVSNSQFNIRPDGMVTVSSLANLDFEAASNQIVQVKVTDSEGLSYIQDVIVNITDVVESAPSLVTNILYTTKGTTTTLTENHLKAVDAQQTPAQLIYTVKNNNTNGGIFWIDRDNDGVQDGNERLAPINDSNPDAVETFSHQDVLDGKIKFTKDNTQDGAKLKLELSDGGETVNGALISASSSPPVVTPADDQEWRITGSQRFILPANTFVDPDYDILTLTAELDNGDPLPTWLNFDAATQIFSGTPVGVVDGDAIDIKVMATDGRTGIVDDTFKLTFLTVITTPNIATLIGTQVFDGSGIKSFTFDANTFNEPNSLPLTYTATLSDNTALPSWLSFNPNTRTFNGNPPADAAPGPYWIKVNASSTGGDVNSSFKLFVYNPNDLPTAPSLSDQTINDDQMHSYTIQASQFADGDGDTIELNAISDDGSAMPSWIIVETDASTGDLTLEVTAPAGAGSQLIRILATDGKGGEASSDFTINYSGGVNRAPQVQTNEGITFYDAASNQNVTTANGKLEQFSVSEGRSSLITIQQLNELDPDDDGTDVIYTVTTLPAHGNLWLDSDNDGSINGGESALTLNSTFTQSDIDDLKLRYIHTGGDATDDNFIFSIADDGENGVSALTGVLFSIQVLPVPVTPEILLISRYTPVSENTNADELFFKVSFSESVQGVEVADFITTGNLAADATIESVSLLAGPDYLVKLSGAGIANANGTLGIALATNPTITDFTDIALDENSTLLANETYTLDNIAPVVTLSAQGIHDGSTSFTANISFDDIPVNMELADISVSNATLSNLVEIDNHNWQVIVTPTTGLDIDLSFVTGGIADAVGNTNLAVTPIVITRNIPPVISLQPGNSTHLTVVYTELDGADNATNDVAFSTAGISVNDVNADQNLVSLTVGISSAEIVDGTAEQLLIEGAVAGGLILLNFNDGDAISNISVNGNTYAVTASVNAGNSILQFTKAGGGTLTLLEAETLLDAFRYNNTSDSLTDANRVFSLTVNDGFDNSIPANLTVDVTPVNDTPISNITPNSNTVSEIGNASSQTITGSGSISSSDLDNATLTASNSYNNDIAWNGGVLSAAQINILTTGFSSDTTNWNYSATLDLDFLSVGEAISFSYNVVTTDSHGANAVIVVSMSINGTNDTPTISATSATVSIESIDASSQNLSDSGTLTFNDLDSNDSLTLTNSYNNDISWTGGTLTATQINTLTNGFSTSGADWSYNANLNLDFLSTSETISFSFNTVTTDLQGANAIVVTSIRINGSNDTPTISATSGHSITESIDASSQNLRDSGTLSLNDLDNNDSLTVTNSYNNDINWTDGTLNVTQMTELTGGFSTTATDWSYGATLNLDFLSVGEAISFSYNIIVTDLQGATATTVVRITVSGSNDIPTISVTEAAAVTEAIDANSQTLSDSGIITFNDLNSNDSLTITNSYNNDINWTGGTLSTDQITALTSGFNTRGTNWTYDAQSKLDFLSVGESISFSFNVNVTDLQGTAATAVLSMVINGSNDTPIIIVTSANAFTEAMDANGQNLNIDGSFSISDIDSNDSLSVSSSYNNDIVWNDGTLTTAQINSLINGFSISGTDWNYAANANLDFISFGGVITFSFNITTTDSQGAEARENVVITINGTNDIPVVSSLALSNEQMGVDFNYSRDVPPYFSDIDSELSYQITGLPPGIEYSPATRQIIGKPITPGLFTIVMTATDEQGESISRSYQLNVILPDIPVNNRPDTPQLPNDAEKPKIGVLVTDDVENYGTARVPDIDVIETPIQERSNILDGLLVPTESKIISEAGAANSLNRLNTAGLPENSVAEKPHPHLKSVGSSITSEQTVNTDGNKNTFSPSTNSSVKTASSSSNSAETTTISEQSVNTKASASYNTGEENNSLEPSASKPSGNDGIRLINKIPELHVSKSVGQFVYLIPIDTFSQTDSNAKVVYKANLLDGTSLPSWLSFHSEKGEFKGIPPVNMKAVLEIKIIAIDDKGGQAEVIVRFRFNGSEKATAIKPMAGLSSQLKTSGVFNWKAEQDELIRHARDLGRKVEKSQS